MLYILNVFVILLIMNVVNKELIVRLCRTLKEMGVRVEHMTGRAMEEGCLTVSDCLLGQIDIIIDDQNQ